MEVKISIDENELKQLVIEKVAATVIQNVFEPEFTGMSWDDQKKAKNQKIEDILKKIDWKNAGSQVSEVVVQKFFLKLLDK